jgi:hypothetical protein
MSATNVDAMTKLLAAAKQSAVPVKDVRAINADYRARQVEKPSSFIVKFVFQNSTTGVKGPYVASSGLSKSATRFGIDQGLITLTKIKSTPGLNSGKSAKVYKAQGVDPEACMNLLNLVDSLAVRGGSKDYAAKYKLYSEQRGIICRTYGIHRGSNGKLIFPTSEVEKAYCEEMRPYSFASCTFFVSVSAPGSRATRSKSLRCLEGDELYQSLIDLATDYGAVSN